MTSSRFISYAQNREDVVLHRALRDIEAGSYIDVGANDPTEDSVSRAFYDAGWRGITIEPVHEFAERQRAERPGDIVVEAAINEQEGGTVELLQIGDARLSTLVSAIGTQHEQDGWEVQRVQVPSRRLDAVLDEAGWADRTIHFLSIDTEGAEQSVLQSIDLRRFRPWILVIEATQPQSAEPSHQDWEPMVLAADYRFELFDGLSRFYVAQEKWDDLHTALSAPASVLDDFVTYRSEEREVEIRRLTQSTVDLNAALEQARRDRDELTAAVAELTVERAALTADRDQIRADADARAAAASARAKETTEEIVRWRAAALGAWSRAVTSHPVAGSPAAPGELTFLRNHTHFLTQEMAAMKRTLSWRITGPLRSVRRLGKLVGR